MQELIKLIVKRIQAIEDAFRENTRAIERMEIRLARAERNERPALPPGFDAWMEAVERRASDSERTASELSALAARLDEALNAQHNHSGDEPALQRINELADVVAGLHSSQQALRESLPSPATGDPAAEQLGVLDERLAAIESSISDFRSMADHVIAHEAVLTTVEHHVSEQMTRLGSIEEQAAAYQSQFEIFDRQLAGHRADMNVMEERAKSSEERLEELKTGLTKDLISRIASLKESFGSATQEAASRIDGLEQRVAAAGELPQEHVVRIDALANRMDTGEARLASLSERIESLQSLHGDVVRHGEELQTLRRSIDEVTGERLDEILERLDGVDRLAADVASHAGQLATIRGRHGDSPPAPIVVTGESSPEMQTRVEQLAADVRQLRESSTMLDSIRTLLAASDVEKMFDELRDRVNKIDAQVATLFTLQRMSAESENAPVLTLEQD